MRCAASSSSSRKPRHCPRALIAETIDLIAVLSGRGSARRLAELALVEGLGAGGDYVLPPQEKCDAAYPGTPYIRYGLDLAFLALAAAPAYAAGSNMPWEQPLTQILIRCRARSPRYLGDHYRHHRAHARLRRNLRRISAVDPDCLGLSIAFAASSFFLSFFQFGGGALI